LLFLRKNVPKPALSFQQLRSSSIAIPVQYSADSSEHFIPESQIPEHRSPDLHFLSEPKNPDPFVNVPTWRPTLSTSPDVEKPSDMKAQSSWYFLNRDELK
jgi:hypothetical protein